MKYTNRETLTTHNFNLWGKIFDQKKTNLQQEKKFLFINFTFLHFLFLTDFASPQIEILQKRDTHLLLSNSEKQILSDPSRVHCVFRNKDDVDNDEKAVIRFETLFSKL